MTRGTVFAALPVSGAIAIAAVSTSAQENDGAAPAPPNIVFIISDDQAWTDYGFMEHPRIRTPRIDQLAAESLTFTRGYVPSSLCRPSLATMITGLFPRDHRITSNDPPLPLRGSAQWDELNEAMDQLITEISTLPRMLGEKLGYVSFQSGKWWEGSPRNGGFTDGMTHGDPDRGGRHGDAGLKIGREGMKPVTDFIDRAIAREKPFFLWYAPFLPHAPHTPPERILQRYEAHGTPPAVARYEAMCEWFDETCGELLDHLDANGLRENTLVVYVSDNGWIQDPERPNRYAERSKRSPYDGGLRTPIMIRWPGNVTPRMDRTIAVSSIDLAPTVLAAIGIEMPQPLPGVDLLDADAVANRPQVFGDVYLHNVIDLDRPVSALTHRWVVEGAWKLISPFLPNSPGGTTQLFNLADDPHEQRNLSAANPDITRRLLGAIDAWYPLPPH